MDDIEFEILMTKRQFNLNEIIEFTLSHDVQIIRGEDYQYSVYIDSKCYGHYITHIGALCFGVNTFKRHEYNNTNRT